MTQAGSKSLAAMVEKPNCVFVAGPAIRPCLMADGSGLATRPEPVINFRAGGVLPQHMRAGDPFSPQPFGLGPVFLISVSLVARRFPILVAPRSWN